MNFIKRYSYLAIFCILISVYLSNAKNDPFAEDDNQDRDNRPKQIRIHTESYRVTAEEFASIMSDPISKNNQDNLRDSLLEKAKKGEAQLISIHSLVCRSGERASVESVQEYILPTEADLPDGLPFPNNNLEANMAGNIFPVTPMAYETKNLGHTLEIEPVIRDQGKTIDLRLSNENVKHVSDHVISEWIFPYAKITVAFPTFYTKRLETSVTVSDGEFLLATTFSPEKDGKPDHSHKLLYFVRAEVLIVGEER